MIRIMIFWSCWFKMRPYQKCGPTADPTIQTRGSALVLACDSKKYKRRSLKYSGTYGRWRGAHWHLPPTLPPRAVDFWKGRRRQQFCPGATGLCMRACRFLNLIVSFRKNTLLKHEPHSAFRGACYIYSHSLFKTISWWCAFCCLGCSNTNQALHHWQGDCWLGAGSYS